MPTTHTAEVTDPLTGRVITLTAATAEELDALVDEHLAHQYPDPGEEVGG